MPPLIPFFLFSTNALRDEQRVCRVWGIAEEWCHRTFFCDLHLHFSNCVSSISLILDPCIRTNEILSLVGRAVSEADLWAAGGDTDVLHCKQTSYGQVLKETLKFWVEFPFTTTSNIDSLKKKQKKKTICRQSQELLWPWIKLLSPQNWHCWFHIKQELIYYEDTESYHCTSELISYQTAQEQFWR